MPTHYSGGGIIKSQHEHVAFDTASWKPVPGTRPRRYLDLETSVVATYDFLAGESMTIDGVGDQPPFRIVKRQGPKTCRRCAADKNRIAPAFEPTSAIICFGMKCNAIAGTKRQLAAASDDGARIGINFRSPGFRMCRPGADPDGSEWKTSCGCEPCPAKPDRGGNAEG